MADNKGQPIAGKGEQEQRRAQEALDEVDVPLRKGAPQVGGEGRTDVSDEDVGQDGLMQKGQGGYGADPDSVGPKRSDKPVNDNG
jgi:hypothetical protein